MSGKALSPSTVVRLNPAVRFRVLDDEGVVIHQRAGEVLVVNEVGARILQLADGQRDIDALLTLLATEWSQPRERLRRDAFDYLHELRDAGIIEPAQ